MERKPPERRAPLADIAWLPSLTKPRRHTEASRAIPARRELRRAVNLEVIINHGLSYSERWQLRDLSLTGAFIEKGSGKLQAGSYVEVVLRYQYGDQFPEHRLAATVTRIEPNGIALTFSAYDDETYTDLANLISMLP